MSKKILLLYFTPKQKAELKICENVFKAVFRKFRKSALFSYMQIDTSPSCRNAFKEILLSQISRHDAVLINSGRDTGFEEQILTKEILGLFATENHLDGRVLCYPPSYFTCEDGDGYVSETQKILFAILKKASALSLQVAKARKHRLTVCTNRDFLADRSLFSEAQNLFDKSLHIQSEHLSLDEMICLCMRTIPAFDVVLSTESTAKIIAMHLTTHRKAPAGYLLLHTENGRIYLKQTSPHEEMSNAHLASLIMAFSAILENELEMKGASHWLKKSVATVFETHAYVPQDEFLNKVITETKKPMRTPSIL